MRLVPDQDPKDLFARFEAHARKLAPPGVTLRVHDLHSAPPFMTDFDHPMLQAAVRALAEVGVDASAQHSKGLDAIPLDAIDLVVTLCAEEVCPLFPRPVRKLHWPLPDPARATGSDEERLAAFRAVRDELAARLAALLRADG